jgi:hypothetical protein
MECVSKKMEQSSLNVTKLGDYGDNATPAPASLSETVYTATTVSFTAASGDDPAFLTDSQSRFADNHIPTSHALAITTTSGTNDGSYTTAARGVSRGTVTLASTDSLTTETAATAGTVTIKRVIYEPNVVSGCGHCGSLNSKL